MNRERKSADGEPLTLNGGSRRWTALFLSPVMLLVLLMLPEVLARPLFGDDAYYIWGATQISHGYYPIRDFFAIDPAGAWAYFCLIHSWLGEGSVAYWATMAANVLTTAWLLGVLARRFTGSLAAGIWAGLLFTVFQFRCTPAYGLVGKDMLGFPFILAGLLLADKARWWILGHLLVGVGLAIKPTLGAIWIVWMAADGWLNRANLGRWLVRALVAAVMIGLPFLAATLWAEQHGWGWAAFRVNAGLRSSGYGDYWSGSALYKLVHVVAPSLWLVPLALLGCRTLRQFDLSRHALLAALLLGGCVNWIIQPMFNGWYFVPFLGGGFVLAGCGIARLLPGIRENVVPLVCCGLLATFVPATNLRWVKLLGDIHGKEPYALGAHQSRIMANYGLGNTPPHIQRWIQEEVAKLVKPGAKVGVLVTDGNLLWTLRDYAPGFWADWSPSWNPDKLAEGVAAGQAEVLVGVEPAHPGEPERLYYDQVAKLRWEMPEQAVLALKRNYEPVARNFGYVIYRRRG